MGVMTVKAIELLHIPPEMFCSKGIGTFVASETKSGAAPFNHPVIIGSMGRMAVVTLALGIRLVQDSIFLFLFMASDTEISAFLCEKVRKFGSMRRVASHAFAFSYRCVKRRNLFKTTLHTLVTPKTKIGLFLCQQLIMLGSMGVMTAATLCVAHRLMNNLARESFFMTLKAIGSSGTNRQQQQQSQQPGEPTHIHIKSHHRFPPEWQALQSPWAKGECLTG